MGKSTVDMVLTFALILSSLFAGCQGSPDTAGSATSSGVIAATVQGVAATGMPIIGTVTLKDSSEPPRAVSTLTNDDGAFSFTVSDLTPPFILRADWTDDNGSPEVLHSFAECPGIANINPFSNVAYIALVGGTDSATVSEDMNAHALKALTSAQTTKKTHGAIISSLQKKMDPLFVRYGTKQNPHSDHYVADHTGLDAMFDDVKISVTNGMITVTNKETGKVIYAGPINNIPTGIFDEDNMPGGVSGIVDGAELYAAHCSSCHGPLATSTKRGRTAAQIQAAIRNVPAMNSPQMSNNDEDDDMHEHFGILNSLLRLTALQIQAIANALSGGTTPAACAYTYSAWGVCQSNGTQTRTVLTKSPSGCTGTPVLTRACTEVPPATIDGAALYTSKCSSCHGSLTTSSMRGKTATQIQAAIANVGSMSNLSSLTAVQIQAIATALGTTTTPSACAYTYSSWGACQSNNTQTRTVASSSPTGCTGTPVLSQPCAYVTPGCTYTYNAWGTCQSNNTQTRTVASSSPTGCTGTPVLSQSCAYVAPSCTYTYNAWGACQSNNTQTRTVASSSPSGCTGTPVLSQSCAYVPPTPACGSCHAIPPSSGRHPRHVTQLGFSCATCHGAGYSTTTVSAATHANGVKDVVSSLNFNAGTKSCSPGCHGSRTW